MKDWQDQIHNDALFTFVISFFDAEYVPYSFTTDFFLEQSALLLNI